VVPLWRRIRDLPSRLHHLVWRLLGSPTRWVTVHGGKRLFVRADDFRAHRIAQLGGTQKEKIALWRELAGWKPTVCVDVGANYGEFAMAAREMDARVIAVEPNPLLVECLRRSFADDGGASIVDAAVSDSEGTVTLHYNARSSGSGSMSGAVPEGERSGFGRPGKVVAAQVRAAPLDAIVPEILGALPESIVLKVDVEGFEQGVLAGADAILRSAGWWRALIEYNPAAVTAAGLDPAALWQELRKHRGMIVGDAPIATPVLAGELPRDPPSSECDVLIGRGSPFGI
jgi:FkbM family methyltransferase